MAAKLLIVGIGSSHGDDRAGWAVIEQLQARPMEYISLRKASVPHDLLDWIAAVDALHIVDSYMSESRDSQLQRFELQKTQASNGVRLQWKSTCASPSDMVPTVERAKDLRSAGSHRIDIPTVLELAYCLGQLPGAVVLWAIPGLRFSPGESISAECDQFIRRCVEEITMEIGDA